jgi:hypothetical protein
MKISGFVLRLSLPGLYRSAVIIYLRRGRRADVLKVIDPITMD